MRKEREISLQEWIPFEDLLEKGIIKMKTNDYIKIINIIPINYNLKSDLEKTGILNSYKTFLKTCNFDIQIIIQSSKSNLSKHISKVKEKVREENNLNLLKISEKYINFITRLNNEKKSSSKNFYIVIKASPSQNLKENREKIAISELNEKFFKIKECLSRCGNMAYELTEKNELKQVLFTFFNTRKNFLN